MAWTSWSTTTLESQRRGDGELSNMITTYPDLRWYEAKVTGWKCTSSLKSLVVSVCAKDTVANCNIKFIDEVNGS